MGKGVKIGLCKEHQMHITSISIIKYKRNNQGHTLYTLLTFANSEIVKFK